MRYRHTLLAVLLLAGSTLWAGMPIHTSTTVRVQNGTVQVRVKLYRNQLRLHTLWEGQVDAQMENGILSFTLPDDAPSPPFYGEVFLGETQVAHFQKLILRNADIIDETPQKTWQEGTNPVGTITEVVAGSGLAGGGTSGSVSLSIANQGVTTQHIADNAITSAKIADGTIQPNDLAFTPGDITEVQAGTGLTGGGSSGPVTLSFSASWGDNRYVNEGQSAGGDLSGSYPNPTVRAIQGRPVSSSSPSSGYVLKWNGSQWAPAPDATGSSYWNQSGSNLYPVNTSWKVGIGTTSPSYKLQVEGGDTYLGGGVGINISPVPTAFGLNVYGGLGNSGILVTGHSQGSVEYGVYSQVTTSTTVDAIGVYGYCDAGNNWGIGGQFEGGYMGVRGEVVDANGFAGVYGYSSGSDYGVYASGNLGASGTKSAVVRTSKGPREMYTIEAPEVWFEDFGTARLVNGRAHVELDPDFLETVTIDEEHPMKVFITLLGETQGVYVKKGLTGFDVIERNNGTSNVEFDYRVVAKRKGYEDQRMKPVEKAYVDMFLYPHDAEVPAAFIEKRMSMKRTKERRREILREVQSLTR